ncbi:lens fiber membrane intrinsic protein-like [Dreissena polymorpha]|uniref:lens fiber membrane intrinsic protein-like n=1 Tax=Dreissena polymorpha TaxID=45954 RepID=UPI0022652FAD|nr:lens fiber membrane intrinsic protein-like [Dreissena polymorpha]XP_052270774.1 lens fiber membrane intrinsic protein-like [Dreissena polymorpha]
MALSKWRSILVLSLTLFTLLLVILAMAMNQWQHMRDGTNNGSVGIWRLCAGNSCYYLPYSDDLGAVRAMMFLGMFSMLSTIGFHVLSTYVYKDLVLFYIAAVVSPFMGGLFLMIAFAVYADDIKLTVNTAYGSSFALTVISWLLAWIITGLTAYEHIRNYFSAPTYSEERRGLLPERQDPQTQP